MDAMAGYTATEDVGVIDVLLMNAVAVNTLMEDRQQGETSSIGTILCRVKRRRLMRTRGPRVGVRGHVDWECVRADYLE